MIYTTLVYKLPMHAMRREPNLPAIAHLSQKLHEYVIHQSVRPTPSLVGASVSVPVEGREFNVLLTALDHNQALAKEAFGALIDKVGFPDRVRSGYRFVDPLLRERGKRLEGRYKGGWGFGCKHVVDL